MTLTDEQLASVERFAQDGEAFPADTLALIAEVRRLRAEPLARAQGVRVAEDVVDACAESAIYFDSFDTASHISATYGGDEHGKKRLAAIVDRVLSTPSAVELAERGVVEAALLLTLRPMQLGERTRPDEAGFMVARERLKDARKAGAR